MPGATINIDPKTEAVFARKGYSIKNKLSEGAFGQVYTAQRTGRTDKLCAVKVMDLEKCSEKFKQKFLPRELAVLITVKHDNVIRIFDIFRANRKIYIFMEFAPNGTIADYLKKNGPVSEPHACLWFTQMADALKFIHEELYIAHRDIKVDNILLDEHNISKLTDFGFAKETFDVNAQKVILSETFCGTEPYYAPQIVARRQYNPFLADVWALGVVLFAMLNNKFPYHFGNAKDMLNEQLDKSYMKGRYVRLFSKEYKDLQEKMFQPKESIRVTVTECLEHVWVKKKGRFQR